MVLPVMGPQEINGGTSYYGYYTGNIPVNWDLALKTSTKPVTP
jgi:hypothetical protein